jgi:phosphoribosylanthranilate isomerase
MKSCLIHGCYDQTTLRTLLNSGKAQLGFDLRPRSTNLVTYADLARMLDLVQSEEVVLVFANDLPTTITSYLDLLKQKPHRFVLEFRDNLPPVFYSGLDHDFYWMFHPDHDWKNILSLEHAKGVLLPLKYKAHYASIPELWRIIDERNLRVILHGESLQEASELLLNEGVEVSVDLSSEVEERYRHVDQNKIKNSSFWRKLNENSSRQ